MVGFLDIIKRTRGSDHYAGDEYGGAAGSDGRGLPTGTPENFMFATGIECSYPTIDQGRTRRDEMDECGHYRYWKDDLWNEQLKSDRAFVTAIKHLVAASTLATHSIARHRPDAVIITSESAEYLHDAQASQSQEVALVNKLRFVALDLLYAHPPDA